MNNKEAIEKVYNVFVVNNTPKNVIKNTNSCVYTHELNGYGCAVGCLLSKSTASNLDKLSVTLFSIGNLFELYKNNLENFPILEKVFEELNGISLDCLQDLQIWHDAEMQHDKNGVELLKLLKQYVDENGKNK